MAKSETASFKYEEKLYEEECQKALLDALDDAISYGTGFIAIDRGLNFKHVTLDQVLAEIAFIKKYKMNKERLP